MCEDTSTIDMLRNNAKTIGGCLAAEEAFLEDKKSIGGTYFLDKQSLDLQNVTFKEIENTMLGKALKHQIRVLENRAKSLNQMINDMRV